MPRSLSRVALFIAVALLGGCSLPPSGAGESPQQRWTAYVLAAREKRARQLDVDLSAAEKEVKSSEGELDETKKKYRKAQIAVINAQRDREFKSRIAELTKRHADAEKKLAGLDLDRRAVWAWEPRLMPDEFRRGDMARLGSVTGEVPIFVVERIIDSTTIIADHVGAVYRIEGVDALNFMEGKTVSLGSIVERGGSGTESPACVLRVVAPANLPPVPPSPPPKAAGKAEGK